MPRWAFPDRYPGGRQLGTGLGWLPSGSSYRMDSSSDRQLALVTGASSGIGLELARQFAEHGFDLLVVAEDEAIEDAARELQSDGGSVQAVRADLATEEGLAELYRRLDVLGRPLDAVALNAGIGAGGAFATDTDLSDELKLIDLNVRSTVHLAKRVLGEMVARGEGRVLFTSSIASTMPGSFQAVYNASKSFVQSFGLALREELKDSGVTITLLMPGPTETEFFERADMLDTKMGASDSKDSAAQVAEQAFEGMMSGKERVEAGSLMSKLQGRASRFIPDSVKAKMHTQMAEPGSANK
jgi:uncharacterized protein